MVTRRSKMLQLVRDAYVSALSVVLLASGWGLWVEEPVWYILLAFSLAYIVLSGVSVILLFRNVHWRGFYFGNAIYQLFPSFILAGLLPLLGFVPLILNVVILFTLREKKATDTPIQQPGPAPTAP